MFTLLLSVVLALACLAFIGSFFLVLLFSTPVGFYHQFTDPGIPAAWKVIHSLLTAMVGIPSLLTAFTVAASLEIGGRRQGHSRLDSQTAVGERLVYGASAGNDLVYLRRGRGHRLVVV